MRFRALVVASLLLGGHAFAQPQPKPQAELEISPRLCIVPRGEQECRVDVELRWHAEQKQAYCVYKQQLEQALQCWSEVAFGELLDALIARSDTRYRLVWDDDGKLVALDEAVLKVVSVVPEDRRRQRRRRHVWSVF